MSTNEVLLLLGVVVGCVLVGFLCGIMLSIKCGFYILNRLGWKLIAISVPDGIDRDNDGSDTPDDTDGDTDDEDKTSGRENSEGGTAPSDDTIMTGRCRGCGLPHIGLIPAVVEVMGQGSYNIPKGSPPVCPRCWCKMNPDKATNIVSQFEVAAHNAGHAARTNGGGGPPVENLASRPASDEAPPFVPSIDLSVSEAPEGVRPVPAHGGYPDPAADNDKGLTDDQLEALTKPDKEAPSEPVVKCAKCGNEKGPFRPQLDGGKPTGKFWCRACVDALGGPPKVKPKKK